jgi:phosphoribosylanthranilate isomerase
VGVFGAQTPAEISRISRDAGLHVVQLHGDPEPDDVRRAREAVGAAVWVVVRVRGRVEPARIAALDDEADAVVFDAFAPDRLGGTGATFDWTALIEHARPRHARLVVAGGLNESNVSAAINALRPHVVDVSSGVELAPGIKDHHRMRAFAEAVRRTGAANDPGS